MPVGTEAVIEALRGNRRSIADSLVRQRWFGGKSKTIADASLHDCALLTGTSNPTLLALFTVRYADRSHDLYFVPLVAYGADGSSPSDLIVPTKGEPVHLRDATSDGDAALALLDGIRHQCVWKGTNGTLLCSTTSEGGSVLAAPLHRAKRLSGEQSNTSILYDDQVILKVVRKVQAGINPDREVLDFLTNQTSYRHVPLLVGWIEYQGPGHEPSSFVEATVGILQTFVPNEGDAWRVALEDAARLIHEIGAQNGPTSEEQIHRRVRGASHRFFRSMERLGEITAELHVALASDDTMPGFRPEPIVEADLTHWRQGIAARLDRVVPQLSSAWTSKSSADGRGAQVERLEAACRDRLDRLASGTEQDGAKIRVHGDYHLGQVLKTDQDFTILDFEGEPARDLEERRAKSSALKDVAGMLRSFDYAGHAALRQQDDAGSAQYHAVNVWITRAEKAFLDGYKQRAAPGRVVFLPRTDARFNDLLNLFLLDKVLYEVEYELNNRPDWLDVPFEGLRRVLARQKP